MKESIRQCSTLTQPHKKLGGSHTTIIGGRHGKKIVGLISQHAEVKKIVPSVITVKGKSNPGGLIIAKVLRPDERGNLRLLISQGTSSQELRIITTVGDVQSGERIMHELNRMILEYIN
ncbi:MAG: DUF2103 domain-containing protein [Methanomethylovorans sp.]|jgi:hypothetical protein|nr:DUF2103 domain-containing protein [Methanomethylovorans sp.]